MKIYISGPITGLPYGNIHAFMDAENALIAAGHEPVNPHRNGLPPDATWEQHMCVDIALLHTCEGVAVLPGCDRSRGCKMELEEARIFNIPVKTLVQWLEAAHG